MFLTASVSDSAAGALPFDVVCDGSARARDHEQAMARSLSDLGVSHVIAGCLFLTRKSATIENKRLTKFFAAKSDKLLDAI
jgi:hypothetical protein